MDLYVGRSSDQKITRPCGILNLLEPGDSLNADRGFDIAEYLPEGVALNISPFLNGKTRRIASVRVHVERTIERVKKLQNIKINISTINGTGLDIYKNIFFTLISIIFSKSII